MKHVAMCSFGKDSVATVLLALEHGEPLDEAVFVEVMFDHSRNISGEMPEHIDWIRSTAMPRFESMGVKTRILRSDRDYMYFFQHTISRGNRAGKISGFPIAGKCVINGKCKVKPIRQYLRSLGEDVTEYIGIAADEPKRLLRLNDRKISLLAKYGYTESMAMELCKRHGLLSPVYEFSSRNGCWFCPNARIATFSEFRRRHPGLWKELELLSRTPNLCSYGFKNGMTVQEVNDKMNAYDRRQEILSKIKEQTLF